jgi:hypothetical protein
MKKFMLFAAAAALTISCSKESNNVLTSDLNQAAHEAQLSVSSSFVVGVIDASGSATITYDLAELEAICACAVAESDATGLTYSQNSGGDYFLSGVASSSGSYTSFAVELELNASNELIWNSTNTVLTCQSDAANPCTLTLGNNLDYSCDNSAGTCVQTPIGDGEAAGSEPCNWPWMVKS